MKNKNWINSILLVLLLPVVGFAQHGFTLGVNYTAAKPLGSFKNVTDKWSWRGWEGNLMYRANAKMSIGVTMGMQNFQQKYDRAVVHESGRDISAVVTNDINVLPLMAKVKYDFSGGSITPFAAIAAGINFIKYDKYYGGFLAYDHVTKFAARPELGLHAGFGQKFGVNFSAAYNYMPYKNFETDGLHNLMLSAGVNVGLD